MEKISGNDLGSQDFFSLKNIEDAINKLRKEIYSLQQKNEDTLKHVSRYQVNILSGIKKNISFYLMRKIIIKKLQEILNIWDNYESK